VSTAAQPCGCPAECDACGETSGLLLCEFCGLPACTHHRGLCAEHGTECVLCHAELHELTVPAQRSSR